MCRVDDTETWDLYRAENRRARKPHRCRECGRTIRPGEHYQTATGLFDGLWHGHRMCSHCEHAGTVLDILCGGWLWDELLDELAEHYDEGYQSPEFAHLIVQMRQGWHDGRDPIPTHAADLARAFLARDLTRS